MNEWRDLDSFIGLGDLLISLGWILVGLLVGGLALGLAWVLHHV